MLVVIAVATFVFTVGGGLATFAYRFPIGYARFANAAALLAGVALVAALGWEAALVAASDALFDALKSDAQWRIAEDTLHSLRWSFWYVAIGWAVLIYVLALVHVHSLLGVKPPEQG